MKKIYAFILIVLLFILGAWTTPNPVANVQTYKYYLDTGNPIIGEKMKEQDMVIVESVEMQQQYITAAQNSGTLIYGYINAMEADLWNEDLFAQLHESDFYHDANGEKLYFTEWDSYMMDMTSPHYREVLLSEIQKQIVSKGLDGVFLDTVGNIESYLPASEQVSQKEAMVSFMQEIKQTYNGLSIGQNWGFNTLRDYTAPYVDFIMWENFSYPVVGNDSWALKQMDNLKAVRAEHGTEVFTIGFSDELTSRLLAESYGFKFLFNSAGSYYNEW